MYLKFKNTKLLTSLLLAAWVGAFSFCGFGAFIPALLGVSHHASDSKATQCEKVCLSKTVASHDTAIGIPVEISPQPKLKPSVIVANAFPVGLGHLTHLPVSDPFILYPSSAKRYQFLSTYRL